jgi:anti-sigma factor RsiW
VKACRDFSLLVSLRAVDALAPEDAPRLDAHLATCERCRAELSATTDALDLARLPAPGRVERRLMADLPERLIADVRKGDRRRGVVRRLAIAGSVAAAFLLALAVPSGLRDRTAPTAPPDPTTTVASAGGTPAAASTWQTPDLDSIWQETDVVDFAADGGDDSEVAYATASYGSDSY